MLTIIFVTIIFLLNLLRFARRRRRPNVKNSKNKIPGIAVTDPDLGNLGDVGRAGSLHQFLTQLHRKYGPVTWFTWGKTPVVSIASPQAFYETRRLFDRPALLFNAFEPLIGENSIQYANGEIGRARRKKHYDAALAPNNLRHHIFEVFQGVLKEKVEGWKADRSMEKIPLHEEMLSMALRSISLAAFGSSLDSIGDEKKIEQAYHACWHEMELRIKGKPVTPEREKIFREHRAYFSQLVHQLVEQREQRLGSASQCFIDYLLDDRDLIKSEEHICDEIITMFVGGFHTTGNLLTWALYYLGQNPTIQDRLYQELKETYQTDLPLIEDIDRMTLLSNVINESLRLSVLAPWAARVSPDENLSICGYEVPAGTPIIQALGVVLHDETIWENPKQFDPDRFNEENKKSLATYAFAPFGFAGKRVCPGYRFAHYEAALFIAGIVRSFQLALVDPEKKVIPVHGLVTAPKEEIFVRFISRDD